MRVSPDTIREDTGLRTVLDRLQTFVSSEQGIRRLEQLDFSISVEETRHRLAFADELQACLRFDDPIPFQATEDASRALKRSRPDGAALRSDEFMAIRDVARTSRVCKSFFGARQEQYPTAASSFHNVEILTELESAIESVFDADGNVRDSASIELRTIRKDLQRVRANLRSTIMKAPVERLRS